MEIPELGPERRVLARAFDKCRDVDHAVGPEVEHRHDGSDQVERRARPPGSDDRDRNDDLQQEGENQGIAWFVALGRALPENADYGFRR